MKIIIEIPDKEYHVEDREEYWKMFKLICDNLDTNGLKCKCER